MTAGNHMTKFGSATRVSCVGFMWKCYQVKVLLPLTKSGIPRHATSRLASLCHSTSRHAALHHTTSHKLYHTGQIISHQATPFHTGPHHTTPRHINLDHIIPQHITPYRTRLHHTATRHSIHHQTTPFHTTPAHTTACHITQRYTATHMDPK